MAADRALEALFRIAEGQDGYFSVRQAEKQGISRHAIAKAALRGRVERQSRGVYRFARFPYVSGTATLWEAVLWPQARGDVLGVLSYETALDLHELSNVNPPAVHITLPRSFRVQRAAPARLVIHRSDLDPEEITNVSGLPVTTVDRTLRDIATTPARAVLADAVRDARARGLKIPSDLQ